MRRYESEENIPMHATPAGEKHKNGTRTEACVGITGLGGNSYQLQIHTPRDKITEQTTLMRPRPEVATLICYSYDRNAAYTQQKSTEYTI